MSAKTRKNKAVKWNSNDLHYALSQAADFLDNEEWPDDDGGAQEAANKEAAKRVRRMASRLPHNA